MKRKKPLDKLPDRNDCKPGALRDTIKEIVKPDPKIFRRSSRDICDILGLLSEFPQDKNTPKP